MTRFKIIYIIALVVILNIILIPFISDENGLIVGEDERVRAYSFFELIEDLSNDDASNLKVPIDRMYYIWCPLCALFIFICALREIEDACILGSAVGIFLLLIPFYEIYLGTSTYSLGLSDAHLTFGYYISCAGFISMLVLSICEYQERE